MTIYIIMANDYVNCAFNDKNKANAYVEQRKLEDNPNGDGFYRHIYWRCIELDLNEEGSTFK